LPNFHLSATGREQATAAGHFLKDMPIAAIYSSPMERAQETAGLILEHSTHRLELVIDERLNECLTPHQGTSNIELAKINHDLYTGNEGPYEQPRDLRRRLLAFIAEMHVKHSDEAIIAVTHGDMVVSSFMLAKGFDENDIGRTRTEANRLHTLGLPEM